MKKFNEKNIEIVKSIISKHRLVSDRVKDLEKRGFDVAERAMGSGGTGQIKTYKKEVRVQVGYGKSRNNYAKCVILSF